MYSSIYGVISHAVSGSDCRLVAKKVNVRLSLFLIVCRTGRLVAVVLDLGPRLLVSSGRLHASTALHYGKDHCVPMEKEAGWAPKPVRKGEQSLAPAGNRTSKFRPSRSST